MQITGFISSLSMRNFSVSESQRDGRHTETNCGRALILQTSRGADTCRRRSDAGFLLLYYRSNGEA